MSCLPGKQAHCLPWQSWKISSATRLFWTKMNWKHVECGSMKSWMFPWKWAVWIAPVASASNELIYFKKWHSCLRLKSTLKIKCNRERGFYAEMGKVKGRRGRPGEPCLQGSYQPSGERVERHSSVCSIYHAHKSSPSTRCKYACMRGNTNTYSTYNRASIIASLLESSGKITWGLS